MGTRQIIALGGGGFSMEPDNPLLDRYILQQANAANPSICLLATASGDHPQYIANFYAAYTQLLCKPSHVTFFSRTPDLRARLLSQDIIFVGGGNTKSMLAVWREWDMPAILGEAWQAGVILAGVSAGAICWFEQGITDSGANGLAVLDCLEFLPGSCCPHFDGEKERRPAYHRFLTADTIQPGYALDDGSAGHFVDDKLARVVSSRPDARAYRLAAVENAVREETLHADFLGD